MAQADAGNCELVVNGFYRGRQRGFLYLGKNWFKSDQKSEPNVSRETLLSSLRTGEELTFMGVVPGSGARFGIDRNGDGILNGDEQKHEYSESP